MNSVFSGSRRRPAFLSVFILPFGKTITAALLAKRAAKDGVALSALDFEQLEVCEGPGDLTALSCSLALVAR